MAYLVVFVLDDPDQCGSVLDAWEAAGARGITILESTGIGRIRRTGIIDDLPLMPSLRDLLQSREVHHRTLLSVVSDQGLVDALVAAAKQVVGDLDEAHTGLLFVVPVLEVHGLSRDRGDEDRPEEAGG
jgi:nitrogen regulatory protein PII